jgi:hypothetical protein
MFNRHFKKEYRNSVIRVYDADSSEPIGEKYGSLHDPILQIVGFSMVLSFISILLFDNVFPFFGLCEPIMTGSIIPVMVGVLGAIWGYYRISDPDQEEI